MRIRDKDGNVGEVTQVVHEDDYSRNRGLLVGISANGLWLTPSQSIRFAGAIVRTAIRVRNGRHK